MNGREVVEKLKDMGFFISPDALKLILENENPEELMHRVLERTGEEVFITKEMLEEKEEGVKEVIEPREEVVVERTDFKPIGREIEADVKIIMDNTDKKGKGRLEDFSNYFKNRYEKIGRMLERRESNNHMTSIQQAKKKKGETLKIKGIILDKRETKNGHYLIVLEDDTDTANVLVPSSNKQLLGEASRLMLDEVIAVEGRMSSELFIASRIIQPDVPVKQVKTIEEDIGIAMISDTHIGNKLFLKEKFEKFLEWLEGKRGDEKQVRLAEKIKYLTIAGDLVDGIGIYPGQEEELEITDIFEQYEAFTQYIERIPEHIHVVIIPGNHDAVKTADPQPRLPKELVPRLYELDNVTLASSPSMLSLHGIKLLMYHGTSFADFVGNLQGMSFDNGAKIMVEMLKRRHVHPLYGGRPITPTPEDGLVIDPVPDVFQAGETHNNTYQVYRGVICVNSGTWQQMTPYQVKQGHKATPGIVPVIEAKTGRIKVMHFDKAVSE